MIPPQLDTNGLGFKIAHSCTKYFIFCVTLTSKPMLNLTFNEHTHE